MKRKISLPHVLVLAIVAVALCLASPRPAHADTTVNWVKIGGKEVSIDSDGKVTSPSGFSGTVTLTGADGDSPVLTLDGFSYNGPSCGLEISGSKSVTIVLVGTNSITSSSSNGALYLRGTGAVTISGATSSDEGTLMAVGSKGSGINVQGGSLTIESGKVTATSTQTTQYAAGIWAQDSSLTISGGDVTAQGPWGVFFWPSSDEHVFTVSGGTVTGTGTKDTGCGIQIEGGNLYLGKMSVSGGTVTATSEMFNGLYANGYHSSIVVSGGTLTASTHATSSDANGIRVNGDFTVSDGSVNAVGYDDGIEVGGDLTISGGVVTASGKNGAGFYVRNSEKSFSITSGTVEANGEKSAGIYSYAPINIVGGEVQATSDNYCGIHANAPINIVGGEVQATSNNHYGIYASAPICISGGVVTAATSASIANKAVGLVATETLSVTGGTVTAAGGFRGIYCAKVTNAIPGTGWTNVEGTEGEAAIAVGSEANFNASPYTGYKRVEFPGRNYAITCSSSEHGSVVTNAADALVPTGSTVTITATPEENYELDAITVTDESGATVAVTDNTFTMPASAVTVSATFRGVPATLTFDLVGGTLDGQTGTVTMDARYGDTVTILAAPTREGYEFLYWEGSHYNPGDSYTVTGDHSFTAVWQKKADTPGADTTDTTTTDTTTTNTTNTTTTNTTTTNTTTMTPATTTRSSARSTVTGTAPRGAIPATGDTVLPVAVMVALGLATIALGTRLAPSRREG